MEKIIQIIPADGWSAVYAEKKEDGIYLPFFMPLACWALIEEKDGERRVVGLDGPDYIDSAEDSCNFLGYASPSEGLEGWFEDARKHGQRQKAKEPRG